jgi:hypothetical protein
MLGAVVIVLAVLLQQHPEAVLAANPPIVGVLTVPVDDAACETVTGARSAQVNGSASCFEAFYVQVRRGR